MKNNLEDELVLRMVYIGNRYIYCGSGICYLGGESVIRKTKNIMKNVLCSSSFSVISLRRIYGCIKKSFPKFE